jgi:hypothetical protein
MSEFTLPQLAGAIIGAVTAVAISAIIKLLNSDKDTDY